MARRRFFVDGVHSGRAEIRGDDAHHLTRVLRVEAGQKYEISDNGNVYLAEVEAARKDLVSFSIVAKLPAPKAAVRITVGAALIKFDRFEWVVEKATEIGAERIVPVAATRTEKGLFEASAKRRERWIRIAHEASQQARRAQLPKIDPAVKFNACLATQADCRLFLEENAAPPLLDVLSATRTAADHVAVLTGPEGGWTDAERSQAASAGWQAVSLGPAILRAETAAATALGIVVAAWLTGRF